MYTSVRKQRALLASLTKKLNDQENELKTDTAPGEIKVVKSQITKTKNNIERAQIRLEEFEEEYEKVKAQA